MEKLMTQLSDQLVVLMSQAEALRASPDKNREYTELRKKLSAIINRAYESALKEMCDRLDY